MSILERARALLDEDPVFLDTETTGLGKNDQVVELAIIDRAGKTLLDTLVKPTIVIPPEATAIHGIDMADVAHAPAFGELCRELRRMIGKHPLVMYNAQYDLRLLRQSACIHGLSLDFSPNARCAMLLYAEYHGDWDSHHRNFRWQPLEKAARHCGLPVPPDQHRARVDAELTRKILMFLAGQAGSP